MGLRKLSAFGRVLFGLSYLTMAFSTECTDNMLNIQRNRCFAKYNVDVELSTIKHHEIIFFNTTSVCRNMRPFMAAFKCKESIERNCKTSLQEKDGDYHAGMFSDLDVFLQGIVYICKHLQDVDVDCILDQKLPIKACTLDIVQNTFSGAPMDDKVASNCRLIEDIDDCYLDYFHNCQSRTSGIVRVLLHRYLKPSWCLTWKDADAITVTNAPNLSEQMFYPLNELPEVICSSEQSIQQAQQECFRRENIKLELPSVNLQNGMQAKQSFLDALLANNKDVGFLCSHKIQYQQAMACTIEVTLQCLPSEYKEYLPNSQIIHQLLNKLCDNIQVIDTKCVTAQARVLFVCGYEKALEQYSSNSKDFSIKTLLCRYCMMRGAVEVCVCGG